MRETVEREPDVRSVSYGRHLSLDFAAKGVVSASAFRGLVFSDAFSLRGAVSCWRLEARMGALC